MSLREEAFTALSSPAVDPGGGGFLRSALPAFGYSSVIFVLMKMKREASSLCLWRMVSDEISNRSIDPLRCSEYMRWWLRSVEAWRRSLAFDTCLSLPPSENTFRIRVF
ncbi:hypothetical protein F2Q68_00029665 [Brassica cretica]|uniref:Uncharacterized protein n=1 Tax=Brassica cretica TaxID=69181 RepID=A0A8S9GJB8_BRACR|nr:hypothetical protein F2Q68_00029665 [Brassica cretica]